MLLQDWTEVAVFARIKEAGSRDDLQASHLIATWHHFWLLEEQLLSAQHYVFFKARGEVQI